MIKCEKGKVIIQGEQKEVLVELVLILRQIYKKVLEKYKGKEMYAKSYMMNIMRLVIKDKKKAHIITEEEKMAYTE